MPNIEELIQSLSLDQKLKFLSGNSTWLSEAKGVLLRGKKGVYNHKPYPAGGCGEFDIPPVLFVDGPRGVVSGNGTCFPVSMARGASFDVELEEQVGKVIGKEIRAIGGNFFGGVCINLLRHPAWGRAQETYGEDSYHLGEMGAALTRGVQSQNVMACVKHYALNSIENARFKVNVEADERALREVYLPHFKRCIDEGAASVMSAYNKFRGEQCGESHYLLEKILRDDWGFDGFVISDFIWGIRNPEKAIKNGMDIEMHIHWQYKKMKGLIAQGKVSEEDVDRSLKRILNKLLDFTQRKDEFDYKKEMMSCAEHTQLARKVAEKSMVLLKNDNSLLPFDKNKIKCLAVVGNLINEPNLGDYGSSLVRPQYTVSAYQGIKTYLKDSGVTLLKARGNNPSELKAVCKQADAVVLIAGYEPNDEGEMVVDEQNLLASLVVKSLNIKIGGDRDSLRLSKKDQALLEIVLEENKNVCVSLVGGSAIDTSPWDTKAKAIVMQWYSGMEGGHALAKVLFGDVNPSGKLPFAIPEDPTEYPFFYKNATHIDYDYFHGYTLFDKKAVSLRYPFGFGLSYTQFKIDNFHIVKPELTCEDTIEAKLVILNTGERDGEEVVQIYAGFSQSKVEMPIKKLLAFKKIFLTKGEKKELSFEIPVQALAYYDEKQDQWQVQNMAYELYAGNSSDQQALQQMNFKVVAANTF